MVNSVSTYGQTTYVLSQVTNLEAQYADETTQSSSGLKAQSYSGIAPDAQNVLNLKSQYAKLTAETSAAQNAQYKVSAASNVLGNITSLINSTLTTVSSAISNNALTTASIQVEAQQALAQLVSSLNTQYAGSYLFAGSAINTAPVNTSDPAYTPTSAPGTSNTNYYQGNAQTASVQISDSVTLGYGVTADNPAFEQALRGLSIIVANPTNATSLQQGFALLKQSATLTTQLYSQTSAKANALSDQVTTNNQSLTAIDNTVATLTEADLSEVSVNLSSLNTQLQSSFAALSKLLQLNLSSYLK